MSDKLETLRISLKLLPLTIFALAAVYFMHSHLSAREDSELHQLKITATQEKTILMSAMMTGGIIWNKPASIANVHATYVSSEIGAGLTDVLAIDATENEIYASTAENDEKVDLNGLLKTHRSSVDNATHFSLDTGTRFVTMVSVFNKKNETVGYVAMAWLK